MALGQRRMVYTNLWQNPQFAKLSDKAKILYIGLITLADDDGRLRANSLLLRSQIFPLQEEILQSDVRKWLNVVVRAGLVEVYREKDEYFVQHPNWGKYQSIRKDLYKPSKIPANPSRKRNGSETKSHHNLSQYKLSKEKRENASLSYLENIPEEDIKLFTLRYNVLKENIIEKAAALKNWCESNGRVKKDYRSFLMGALLEDYKYRKPEEVRKMIVKQKTIQTENGVKVDQVVDEELKAIADKFKIPYAS